MAEYGGDREDGAGGELSADRSFFGSSLMKWIGTALPPAAAVVLLAFEDDIHASWPVGPWPGGRGEIAWPAVFYWGCLIGWLVLFILHDRAKSASEKQLSDAQSGALRKLNNDLGDSRKEQRNASVALTELQKAARAEQQEANRRIQEALETLPDKVFRGEFARKAGHLQRYVTIALGSTLAAEELRSMIRGLLSDIAGLASTYGPNEDEVVYRAHIMEYDVHADGQVTLELSPAGAAPRGYDGMLVLRRDLAATMTSDEGDESLHEDFVFGMPRGIEDDEGKLTVMPGPQHVFVKGEFRGILDVRGIDELRNSVRGDVIESFRNWEENPFRGSLVSFPLAVPVGSANRVRIGVVTVYADQPNMIGGHEERWKIFALLMRPYIDGVATLLSRLQELEN